MTDTITLPREVVKEALEALEDFVYHGESMGWTQVAEALRIALASEQPKPSEEAEALRRDAERFRWGVENARWVRHEHEAYVAIPVAVDADLSCTPMRTAAIDAAMKEDKT